MDSPTLTNAKTYLKQISLNNCMIKTTLKRKERKPESVLLLIMYTTHIVNQNLLFLTICHF